MRIAVLLEHGTDEKRVAGTPESVIDLASDGHEVYLEAGAGIAAGMPDDLYISAGASLVPDRSSALTSGRLILGINNPFDLKDIERINSEHLLVGLFDPVWKPRSIVELAKTGATIFSLDLVPRSTRAQAMDVLSSQATVVGYQAILMAAQRLPKLMPMMMTAAGTVPATRVVVLGAGVAGLQSIAMARRLGAVVEGFDIRPEALEEIRSLGARSIAVPEGLDPTDPDVQETALVPHLAEADLVVTAAQIPGKASPILVTETMVEAMRPGSLILDLSTQRGRNCSLTESGKEVEHCGITILGPTNLASGSPTTASRMFARNMVNFIRHLCVDGEIAIDPDDEITASMLVASGGEVVHPKVLGALEESQGE